MSSPFSWSFTTSRDGQCPCSIWQNAAPSGAVDAADTSAVNLGVQFQASSDGTITGVRFYKEPDNTGTHTGSLWTSSGTLLATGTFSGESATGWQELDFSTPVPVTAGTTYVASYHTNAGHYAITSNGLASAVTNGPLTALASGGVYAYGSANAFPSNSFNASNYWVDVVYSPASGATPPVVTSVTPAAGSIGQSGVGRADGDVLPGGGAEHGVVHGDGLGREHGARLGELQRRRHGRDVHARRARWRRAPPIRRRCRGRRTAPARR